MRFLIRKRRSAPAIIIVALIDVLIVLVIFLLVTTTFKQQPTLKLTLPEASQGLKSGANDNPPILVSIEANGVVRYGLSGDVVTPDQLLQRLRADAEKNPQIKLAVRADKSAPWGKIVSVMDAANTAHIKVVSAFTKDAGKPAQ